MADRAIIFSAPMVRAILEGRKTMTRRVLKLGFEAVWTSIHGPGAWEANPWVAAITFRRVE